MQNAIEGKPFVKPDNAANAAVTTDGGATWMKQNSGVKNILQRVIFTSIDTGFIIGEDIILRTVNGGLLWDIQYTSPNDIEQWKGSFSNLFLLRFELISI